jgi:hypothetical protein
MKSKDDFKAKLAGDTKLVEVPKVPKKSFD